MKNKMMRLASLLMVAVLLTTSVVSGTYAKYVTTGTGSDTARVAKWGVELAVTSSLFDVEYDAKLPENGLSVQSKSDPKDNVIAPGTTGTATTFTISGTPEVDVILKVTLNGSDELTDDYTMVTLPMGNGYTDYTQANVNGAGLGTFDLAKDYIPVKWTLTKIHGGTTSVVVNKQNLVKVEEYLAGISKLYNVESDEFASVVGEYVLTWEWGFDVTDDPTSNDKADTYLGQIAAGKATAPSGYVGNESFTLTVTATQVD